MANTVWQANIGAHQQGTAGADFSANIGAFQDSSTGFNEGTLSVSVASAVAIVGEFFSPIDEGVLSVSAAVAASILEELFIGSGFYNEGTLSVSAAATAAVAAELYQVLSTFPEGRPSDYDPEATWDEETGTWVSTYLSSVHSNVIFLVAVNDQGEIYFQEDD